MHTHVNSKRVIFDEVQRAPHLFSYIQTIVDEQKIPGQFILTGSQNYHLNSHISQSLAGRVALFKLLPLSILELAYGHALPSAYEDLVFLGGYPVVHTHPISPLDWYPNYIQTYIERDVRQLRNVHDLSLFQRFIRLCAGRIRQILNASELGRDCGVDQKTVRTWLSEPVQNLFNN